MIDRTVCLLRLSFATEAYNMASSKSSLKNPSIRYSPTHPLLLLLILFVGCLHPSSSAARRTFSTDRWKDPCAGSTRAFAWLQRFTTESIDTLEDLSRRAVGLKRVASNLKNDYVQARYHGNEMLAEEERVQSGYVIAGSPSWNDSNSSLNETLLQTCYENLARLAVLTRLTREGEQAAETKEREHFASRFLEIEAHPDTGLYVIMCVLYDDMKETWGIRAMSPETEAEVARISFNATPSNAIRHLRDYAVLRVLENSADQLSSRFDQLAGRVA